MGRCSSHALAPARYTPRYLDQYLSRLHDPNVAVRRGYALALGSLPLQLLHPVRDEVRRLACCATHIAGAAAWPFCVTKPYA